MGNRRASGGLIGKSNKTSGGGNAVTRFNASGTFKVQKSTTVVDVLTVAGGGGSGGDQGAGGGGAGGFRNLTGETVFPNSNITITVGAGGAAGGTGTPEDGSSGANSVFGNPANPITSAGGGGGGLGDSQGGGVGVDGGSGGGGGGRGDDAGGAGNTPPVSPVQGYAGGKSKPQTSPGNDRGGGGGGAGAAGGDGANDPGAAGNGGVGAPSTVTGTATYYAGGGGGGSESSGGTSGGAGGVGGGGPGGNGAAGTAGTANTGGGGGASGSAPVAGGAGGSGVVIVKELDKAQGVFDMKSQYTAHTKGQWPIVHADEISNSLVFNYPDNPKLTRTIASSGSDKVGTMSFWMKLGAIRPSNSLFIISADQDSNNYFNVGILAGGTLRFRAVVSGSQAFKYQPSLKLRDHSAWYHICFCIDTLESDGNVGTKVYINGEDLYPDYSISWTQNMDIMFNKKNVEVRMGMAYDESEPFDGYLSDFHWIDGQMLNPSHFGEPDPDCPQIWRPKKYLGTYGTNGFHMEFKSSGVGSGSTSTVGADTSGNLNHLTSTNIAATDQSTDTPTNNFATMNPLNMLNGTLSEGNTQFVRASSGTANSVSTICPSNGKWYMEFQNSAAQNSAIGVVNVDAQQSTTNIYPYTYAAAIILETNVIATLLYDEVASDGETSRSTASGAGTTKIGLAVDLDNQDIYVSTNGQWWGGSSFNQGTGPGTALITDLPTTGFAAGFYINGSIANACYYNFGNPGGSDSISSGNADANGYGNFEYAVPSGFYALCSKNLAQYG